MDTLLQQSKQIVDEAMRTWKPVCVICAYSGGYDSLVCTDVVHKLYPTLVIPLLVYSIDTKLSADGWVEYVRKTGLQMGWKHNVYDNQKGFREYVEWVTKAGCPYSPQGHRKAYNRLKDRGFAALLKRHKGDDIHNKVLFLSGIRKYESREREKLISPINRMGDTNAIFANPIFWWTDTDLLNYRLENELPENPFYNTVGGSGDCQCNWGRFITLQKLKKHSPQLASGNVALVDELSRRLHGYGWDGTPEGQQTMEFLDSMEDGSVSPFMCSNCSRRKSPGYQTAVEERYLQASLI